jgi:hypothetical protein
MVLTFCDQDEFISKGKVLHHEAAWWSGSIALPSFTLALDRLAVSFMPWLH